MSDTPYIDLHTHTPSRSGDLIEVVNIELNKGESPGNANCCSAGWHPWEAKKASLPVIETAIGNALAWPQTIALGECGLDRACTCDFDTQMKVFALHLEMAQQHHRPLVVHCVRAYSDLLAILKQTRFRSAFALHAFKGNARQIEQLLNYNVYFSFGPDILKVGSSQAKSLQIIPADRLLLETDTSETGIGAVYRQAAILRSIVPQNLKETIAHNFNAWQNY